MCLSKLSIRLQESLGLKELFTKMTCCTGYAYLLIASQIAFSEVAEFRYWFTCSIIGDSLSFIIKLALGLICISLHYWK